MAINLVSEYEDSLVINHPLTQKLHKQPYQMCTTTVMDTSDPKITFDEKGICNHVKKYQDYEKYHKLSPEAANLKLEQIVDLLRKEGKGKDFDCIMGLSGGVDSSYMAYFVTKKLGLRALLVHVDTGWNSELAVNNIQSIVQKLHLELHTLVIDWEEMKDLQLAFFKSSLSNLDIPQDHCFIASLYQEAKKYNIKYIMNGSNMATESILPAAWGYDASDASHLLGIHKQFGSIPLKTYPTCNLFKTILYYPVIFGMKTITPLNYLEYNKFEAKKYLSDELGWRDYGGKHYESTFTKFFQAHYLPTKFGFDKRKAHLSSLIVSGQMTKNEAILELKKPLYNPLELEEDRIYFAKKLGISIDEYYTIIGQTPTSYDRFPNNEWIRANIRKYLGKLNFLRRL